jgi:hypothetical protein
LISDTLDQWEQNPEYLAYVTEARRRGYSVDTCRQKVPEASSASTATSNPPGAAQAPASPQNRGGEKGMERLLKELKSNRGATVAAVASVIAISEMCRINVDTQMPHDPDIGKKLPVFVGTMGHVVDEAFMKDVKDTMLKQAGIFSDNPEARKALCAFTRLYYSLVENVYEIQVKDHPELSVTGPH